MNRKAGTLYRTIIERLSIFHTGNLGGNAESFRPIYMGCKDFYLYLQQDYIV